MKILIVPLSALALVAAAPALAGDLKPYTEKVAYSDLDLSQAQNVALFDARLAAAVTKVCRSTYQGGRIPYEYVRRCGVGTRASLVKPREAALAASKLKVASTPIVVAAQ